MTEKQVKIISIILGIAFVLVGCGGDPTEVPTVPSVDSAITAAAQTALAIITQTAAAVTPTTTPTPPPTLTPTLPSESDATQDGGLVDFPTLTRQPTDPSQPGFEATPPPPGGPCFLAALMTETIPDGTVIAPGAYFVKTWRLSNLGRCTWTPEFSLVFIDGDILGAPFTIQLTYRDIPSYDAVYVDLELTAPESPGRYRGYWKIQSDTGVIFGLAPDGEGAIWVEIVVRK